jgi:hypothetical protein
MGASANPTETNIFNKAAGPAGWALAIVTAVVFLGLLYNTASHGHDGDHAAEHTEAAPAADAQPADGAH